jgi:hypothetical protein
MSEKSPLRRASDQSGAKSSLFEVPFNKTVKGLRAKTEVDVIEVVGHTDEHPTLITSFSRC